MSLAYLNGEFMPLAEARVSALDRGFLFGDGVYEAIPFYNGVGFGETEHLSRLENSLHALEIPSPLSVAEWQSIFQRLLVGQTEKNNTIYLQITRGATEERSHIFPPAGTKPTVFAYSKTFTSGRYSQGVKAITLEDIRWRDCYIKSLNILPNCIASELARRQNANEAILYRDDMVTEGSSSNVFVVKAGKVFTTPVSPHILGGISRTITLKILQQQNIPYSEENISLASLRHADEIWITSSTREIVPVIKLDNETVGTGKPGTIWQQVYGKYKEHTRVYP